MRTLAAAALAVTRDIPVTIQSMDESFTATFFEASICPMNNGSRSSARRANRIPRLKPFPVLYR